MHTFFIGSILSYNFPFQIPIFEKGYEKDPAVVAKEAIQEASRNGSDVVLVDTAGRMQVIAVMVDTFGFDFFGRNNLFLYFFFSKNISKFFFNILF